MKPVRILLLATATALFVNAGCSSSDDSSASPATGPVGGPVASFTDAHCDGQPVGTIDPAACKTPTPDTGAGGAAADGTAGAAAGAANCDQTHDAEYGDTLSNSEGDDDDCKYHVSWSSTPVRLNADVTFTVTATDKTTMLPLAPLADGDVPLSRLDVYEPCNETHLGPSQNLKPSIAQTAPGTFTAGPIKFDQSGRWVVRFHFYEECIDQDTSPHGHIAFFVDVP